MNVRTFHAIAAVSMAWAVLSAGVARAGQGPDTPPPGTLAMGPLWLTPSLIIKDMGVDENVFNEPVNPKRDFTFTITPRATVVVRVRRLRLEYATATDYVYYRTYRSERGTNVSSSARLTFDLGHLKPYATIQGLNSKSRLNSEIDTRARHRDLQYGAGVEVKGASRTSLLLNGSQTKVSYEPDATFRGVELRRGFDGRRRSVDGGLAIILTPLFHQLPTLVRAG